MLNPVRVTMSPQAFKFHHTKDNICVVYIAINHFWLKFFRFCVFSDTNKRSGVGVDFVFELLDLLL
jgi:hypothetical protein